MRSTSIFLCIMTMISNFTIFFYISHIYFKFFFTDTTDFFIFIVNNFFFYLFKIDYLHCSLKGLQNFFMQFLPLYGSCLFSMLLSDNIVDIERPDGTCLPTFFGDEFSELFLHLSIFIIKHSRSA